jgi:hypothetical protein
MVNMTCTESVTVTVEHLASQLMGILTDCHAAALTFCATEVTQRSHLHYRPRVPSIIRKSLMLLKKTARACMNQPSTDVIKLNVHHLHAGLHEQLLLIAADPLSMRRPKLAAFIRLLNAQTRTIDKQHATHAAQLEVKKFNRCMSTCPRRAIKQAMHGHTEEGHPALRKANVLQDPTTDDITADPNQVLSLIESHFSRIQQPPGGPKTGKYLPGERKCGPAPWNQRNSSVPDPYHLVTGAHELAKTPWLVSYIRDEGLFYHLRSPPIT